MIMSNTNMRAREFMTLFEDSDISRFPEIQLASKGVYEAALYLLASASEDEPSEQEVARAVGAFMGHFADDSAVAAEDQHFMDLVDERRLWQDQGLMDRLNRRICNWVLDRYRQRGNHVVELRETRGWDEDVCGFYVFTKSALV